MSLDHLKARAADEDFELRLGDERAAVTGTHPVAEDAFAVPG